MLNLFQTCNILVPDYGIYCVSPPSMNDSLFALCNHFLCALITGLSQPTLSQDIRVLVWMSHQQLSQYHHLGNDLSYFYSGGDLLDIY